MFTEKELKYFKDIYTEKAEKKSTMADEDYNHSFFSEKSSNNSILLKIPKQDQDEELLLEKKKKKKTFKKINRKKKIYMWLFKNLFFLCSFIYTYKIKT